MLCVWCLGPLFMKGGGGGGMDNPWTDVGLLKIVLMCLLDQKCPCELA